MRSNHATMLAISVCYAVALFHRTAFQAIDGMLRVEFGLTETASADIAAVFFWTYLVVLIPVGLLTDRYGARRVSIYSSLLTALGTVLFCSAGSAVELGAARMLIAAGSVGAFIGMMRYIALAFPDAKASYSGRGIFIGNIGAMATGAPLAYLLLTASWRDVWWGLSVISILLACTVAWLARGNGDSVVRPGGVGSALREVAHLFRSRWVLVGLATLAGLAGSFYAFSNLIAPRWLAGHGFAPTDAGWGVSALVLGYALGAAFWGWLGDMERRRTAALLAACIGALLCWMIMALVRAPAPGVVGCLFLAAGFCCGAFALVYPLIVERHPPQYAGGVIGCVSCGIPLGAAVLQMAAGRMPASLLPMLLVASATVAAAGAILLLRDRMRRA